MKKDRQCKDKWKEGKETNDYLQYTTQKPVLYCSVRRVLRYQRGNQNTEIDEEQTTIIISYHNNVCAIRKIPNGH
jgi:hypothetical protein